MKKSTKNIVRIVICILYIVWGIAAPFTALNALLSLNLVGILTAAVGVIMLLAGIFGLLKIKLSLCHTFGIIIFAVAAVTFVLSIFSGIAWSNLVTALLAWLFIICL